MCRLHCPETAPAVSAAWIWVNGLGFRVKGLAIRNQGSRFIVQGSGVRAWGFRFSGRGIMLPPLRCWGLRPPSPQPSPLSTLNPEGDH